MDRLPVIKDYWSVKERLGNLPIQKELIRARFWDKKIHFADNLNNLTPGDSNQYDRLWKLRPLFDKLLKDYQAMQPESHQLIEEHMCKFKGKSLMHQYMKNEQIKQGFKFWFCCVSKLGYLYDFNMYLRKKENSEFGFGE